MATDIIARGMASGAAKKAIEALTEAQNASSNAQNALNRIQLIENFLTQVGFQTLFVPESIIINDMITAIPDQIYTGSEITPDVIITDNDNILIKDVDYSLTYENNIDLTEAAIVIITGIGNYQGEVNTTFKIVE